MPIIADLNDINKEIDKFVKFFKHKSKFQISNYDDINKILMSQKYSDFIEFVYNFYNKKVTLKTDLRLHPQCYISANQAIDFFWQKLLGNNFSDIFKNKTVSKDLDVRKPLS